MTDSNLADSGDDALWGARRDVVRVALAVNGGVVRWDLCKNNEADVDAGSAEAEGADPPLFYAKSGDAVAALLLGADESAGVDTRGRASRTPLFSAARLESDTSAAQTLLEYGADVNAQDHALNTALHFAATGDMARLLLERGADVHVRNEDGRTPLFFAAHHGRVDVVEALLHGGADPNHLDKSGQTALFEIDAHEESTLAFKGLVQQGASVTALPSIIETPMRRAVTHRRLKTVAFLVRSGAKVDVSSKTKETPLSRAALLGRRELVLFLLDHGASVHGDASFAELPVVAAARGGHLSVVSELLARGASFHPATCRTGGVARTPPAPLPSHLEVLDLLIDECEVVMPQWLKAAATILDKWIWIVKAELEMCAQELKTFWKPLVRTVENAILFFKLSTSASTHALRVRLGRLVLRFWKWPLKYISRKGRAPRMLSRGVSDVDSDALSALRAALDELMRDSVALNERVDRWKRYLAKDMEPDALLRAVSDGADALKLVVIEEIRDAVTLGRTTSEQDWLCVLVRLSSAAVALVALHDRDEVHGELVAITSRVTSSSTGGAPAVDPEAVRWQPPEVLCGAMKDASGSSASDVYSFGMCILDAISGSPPWGRVSCAVVRVLASAGRLPRRPEHVSDEQWELVERMCAKDPKKRPEMTFVAEQLQLIIRNASRSSTDGSRCLRST